VDYNLWVFTRVKQSGGRGAWCPRPPATALVVDKKSGGTLPVKGRSPSVEIGPQAGGLLYAVGDQPVITLTAALLRPPEACRGTSAAEKEKPRRLLKNPLLKKSNRADAPFLASRRPSLGK
jgi:hypothetical protein